MKYIVKVPPTAEMGSYTTRTETSGKWGHETYRQRALADYNAARAHDGLEPVKRMPAGTSYLPQYEYAFCKAITALTAGKTCALRRRAKKPRNAARNTKKTKAERTGLSAALLSESPQARTRPPHDRSRRVLDCALSTDRKQRTRNDTMKQYTPRRASRTRWLQSAPECILDVFRLKDGSHEFLFTGERMLQSGQTPRTFANTHVQGWHEREGWFGLTAYECARYRYRMGKRRVKWLGVPERLRITVIQKVEDED